LRFFTASVTVVASTSSASFTIAEGGDQAYQVVTGSMIGGKVANGG
jgi:hypothetical protein